MKLLVLAQTPPPVHGQSLMVRTLVNGLPAHGVDLHHVNLALSRDAADIGHWRPGKIFSLLGACARAVCARFRHGCDTLYYVPAPGKRGALWRDLTVMLLCRPFFRKLVLHWHATGLGAWLSSHATAPERWITQLLLGRADLAIVLGESLRTDAAVLAPARTAVVRNGIVDPCPGFVRAQLPDPAHRTALFLGLCTEDKGLFDAIRAVQLANDLPRGPRWKLRVAGSFVNDDTRTKFLLIASRAGDWLQYEGFAQAGAKHRLLAEADVLLFPTYYPAETQGLVVAEALAHDLPVILTRWHGVDEQMPQSQVYAVECRRPDQIADQLAVIASQAQPAGTLRAFFLKHYTVECHLGRMSQVLANTPAS